MAISIKTLATGRLKIKHDTALLPGERLLYAAPHPSEPFHATGKKSALVTAMRFFHSGQPGQAALTMNLYFVRYDSQGSLGQRDQRFILPLNLNLNSGELKVDSTPLVLEEGDAILGDASVSNTIQYVISGVEQEV